MSSSGSSEQFRLRSRNYHEKLFQNIQSLDIFLDAILSIDGKTIQVHRFVLAAGSKYFHDLLKRNDGLGVFPVCK